MPREQGDSGEFVETIAPEDVLDVFDAVDGPVVLSADVADHFDVTRQTARRKLEALYDRGALDRRKVSRRVVYWRDDGGSFDAGGLQGDPDTTLADTGDESGRESGSTVTPSDSSADTVRRGDGAETVLDEALRGWEPDTQADAKTARTQTRRTVEYLQANAPERFTRSALVDALAGESSLGDRSWWERAVQPGLRRLAERDLVEYRAGHHDYRWIGDP